MNHTTPVFVDSHLHLDLVLSDQPHRIGWLRQVGCLPVSWAFGRGVHCTADLEAYLTAQRQVMQRIRETGLCCYYLAGIHPRNLPLDLAPENVARTLTPFLKDPFCVGVGEIGLETGDEREKEILASQMELARDPAHSKMVFGVHTPRGRKELLTEKTLALLEAYSQYKDRLVVDHCTVQTAGWVLERGLFAGMTVSPVKSTGRDVLRVIENHPGSVHRLMVNTDSGDEFYEDLYHLHRSEQLPQALKARLVRDNALGFFGIFPARRHKVKAAAAAPSR